MKSGTENIDHRLTEWLDSLARFDLPDWESLPQLDLYMDQVVLLLTRYLSPMSTGEDERFITASIINNYVRMKIMPPPVKKKYSRSHLAYLVMICTLKQSLSISCIQRLLPEDQSEDAVRMVYTEFVTRWRTAVALIRRLPEAEGRQLLEGAGDFVMTSAILSTLSKALTEFLLRDDGDEYDEYDE